MDRKFQGHGVRFLYPSTWQLVEETKDAESIVSLTVHSPETSFWSLTLFYTRPDARSVLESALQAFRDEYQEIDFYPAQTQLCGRENLAMDCDFYCMELLNSAFLRSFHAERFTALVLYQSADVDLDRNRGLLEKISNSLECDALTP